MKNIAIFLFVILFFSCKDKRSHVEKIAQKSAPVETPNLTIETNHFDPDFIIGRWESTNYEKDGFELWLNIDEEELYGQYCAVNESATRIDCGEKEDDCFVKAPWPIVGTRVELQIKSCYSGQMGIVFLEVLGEELKWKLMVAPGKFGIDHLAPTEVTLVKVHFDPFE